jgi:hypothetical protein
LENFFEGDSISQGKFPAACGVQVPLSGEKNKRISRISRIRRMERHERACPADQEEIRDRVTYHVSSIAQNSPKAVALHALHRYGGLKIIGL